MNAFIDIIDANIFDIATADCGEWGSTLNIEGVNFYCVVDFRAQPHPDETAYFVAATGMADVHTDDIDVAVAAVRRAMASY